MVRLTPLLRFGGPSMEMPKIVYKIPGFDKKSLQHNWSLLPLLICSVLGGIVAARHTYYCIIMSKDTANYREKYVFALESFSDKSGGLQPAVKTDD